jgi:hypothetical protein
MSLRLAVLMLFIGYDRRTHSVWRDWQCGWHPYPKLSMKRLGFVTVKGEALGHGLILDLLVQSVPNPPCHLDGVEFIRRHS